MTKTHTTYKLYKNNRYCQVIGVRQTFRKLRKYVHLQSFIRPVDFFKGQNRRKTAQMHEEIKDDKP